MAASILQKVFMLMVFCISLVIIVEIRWPYSFKATFLTGLSGGTPFYTALRNTLGLNKVTRSYELLHNMSYMTKYIGNNILPVTANDNSKYLIENPVLCDAGAELSFLLIVHTATNHHDRRQFIRDTWMNKNNIPPNISARVLFLLGTTPHASVQNRILSESRQYGDILQGDFVDTYHNLTHKGVMAYRWISQRCQNTKYIVKIDDDAIIDIESLWNLTISSMEGRRKLMMCQILKKGGIIRRQHRWHVDKSLFPGQNVYPTYCRGAVVVITNDLPRILYEAAKTTPFFWVDDVYLYGLLPNRVPGFGFLSIGNICEGPGCISLCRKHVQCDWPVTFNLGLNALREEWNRMLKS